MRDILEKAQHSIGWSHSRELRVREQVNLITIPSKCQFRPKKLGIFFVLEQQSAYTILDTPSISLGYIFIELHQN